MAPPPCLSEPLDGVGLRSEETEADRARLRRFPGAGRRDKVGQLDTQTGNRAYREYHAEAGGVGLTAVSTVRRDRCRNRAAPMASRVRPRDEGAGYSRTPPPLRHRSGRRIPP